MTSGSDEAGTPRTHELAPSTGSGSTDHGLIAEADVDRAPGLHGDLDQDIPIRVGGDRRWWLDGVRVKAGTGPADVRNLHGFQTGDDDVIRRVLAETLLAGITARGDHNCEQ